MKHLLLSFLCAGLCLMASAAVPRVNIDAQKVKKAPSRTLITPNRLGQFHSQPAPINPKQTITPQNFFSKHGVTPNDNRLLKKAPLRLDPEDLLNPKLAFMMRYEPDFETGNVDLAPDYMWGGWNVSMEQYADDYFGVYLLYQGLPFGMSVDYENKTAELFMEALGAWQWADTTKVSSRYMTINDTTEYLYLLDENYLMSLEYDEPNNLIGTVYDDGTIYFPDGWCVYRLDYVTKTVIRNGLSTVTYDTIEALTGIFRDTYLLTPNAMHEYDVEQESATSTSHAANYAYMYQYDDTTAVVWNLWGLGGRGTVMYIHEDGSMTLPSWQVVATEDVAELEAQFMEYDWSEGYEFILLGYDTEIGDYTTDDTQGTVTSTGLAWDASQFCRYCLYKGNYYALFYPAVFNNELTFINGERFVFGKAEKPEIVVTEGDNAYTFEAVPTEEGTRAYLYTYDPELYTIVGMVNNPYEVERTTEDQVIYLAAVADGYDIYKNPSDWVVAQFVVPAIAILPGDIDGDGIVGLDDLLLLENVLVNETYDQVNSDVADVNGDGTIDLLDVTAMIKLINGE